MTGLIRRQLTGLAGHLADLKERVRVAVAGELGRAVSEAVRQVVQAVVAGRPDPPWPAPPVRRPPDGRWDDDDGDDGWGRPRDPWADAPDEDDGSGPDGRNGPAAPVRHEAPATGPRPTATGLATAVAAGVYAARWWLRRTGAWLAAAGVGLGVGLVGVLGGPVARTAVAALAAVGDVLGATDALGGGAARLRHV